MTLKEQLTIDLKTAMLAREGLVVDVLKGLKSAILNQEIASGKREEGLNDNEIEALFAREAKKRDEAAGLYQQGGNQEMADKERSEKEIIKKYLPQQLSDADIEKLVSEAITSTGASELKDIGKVIGLVKSRAGNSADGGLVAKIARERLQ